MDEIIRCTYSKLTSQQIDIVSECVERNNGIGLSLSMGSGKTIISLMVALIKSKDRPFLVICSKTLIQTWINEINKFFGDKLKYAIFHSDYIKDLSSFELTNDINLIITTPQLTSKYYDLLDIQFDFVRHEIINLNEFNQHEVVHYIQRSELDNTIKIGGSILHRRRWGCLIVDEAHNYTKITTNRSRSIISISSKFTLALSGTLFTEPTPERFLGYHLLINDRTFPDNLPDVIRFLRSNEFLGVDRTIISKTIVDKINYNSHIVICELTRDERKVFICIRNLVLEINKKITEQKRLGRDTEGIIRKFNAQKMGMLCYLRQCLVSPLIPISNVALDMYDLSANNELSRVFNDKLNELDLTDYLSDENNIKSSRIGKALEIIEKHQKIIVFSIYRTSIDILKTFITNRKVFVLTSEMSIQKRIDLINKCSKCEDNYVLLTTYDLGSEGLNLQFMDNCLLLDFDWSDATTSQSIARIVRNGNKSKNINVYNLISNTGIENAIFKKQKEKNVILEEVKTGAIKSNVSKIKLDEIIKFLSNQDNIDLFQSI